MRIIEVDYQLDDYEIIDLFLGDFLSDTFQVCESDYLSIIGDESDYSRIKKLALQQYNIQIKNILFLGKTPYTRDERNLIYYFYSLSIEIDEFHLFIGIADDSELIKFTYEEIQKNIGGNLSNVAYYLNKISNSGPIKDLLSVHNDLLVFKKNIEENYPNLISSCIKIGLVQFINLIDLEIKFYLGNESRSYGQVTSILEKINFNRLIYANEIAEYKSISTQLTNVDKDNILKRIEYLEVCNAYSEFNPHNIDDSELFWLFIWWSSYFLICANFYKRANQFSAGVSMCIRALELFCKAILLDKGNAYYDGNGKFCCNGKRFNGVGPLWNEVLLYLPSANANSNIWTSIEVRNKSVFGHGITHMNEDLYDFVYSSISTLIKDNEDCRSGREVNWDEIHSRGRVNMFNGIVKSISTLMISSMGITDKS